jgi:hypothetical protein
MRGVLKRACIVRWIYLEGKEESKAEETVGHHGIQPVKRRLHRTDYGGKKISVPILNQKATGGVLISLPPHNL